MAVPGLYISCVEWSIFSIYIFSKSSLYLEAWVIENVEVERPIFHTARMFYLSFLYLYNHVIENVDVGRPILYI